MPDDKSLIQFVSAVAGDDQIRVEENLGAGFVRLMVSEAERRQAKHDIRCIEDAVVELLRNARDAGARHIFVATSREADTRTLTIIDDGSGIPVDMQSKVFDARVTSKLDTMHMDRWGVHGRGMALYSIKQNTVSAQVLSSAPGMGTSLQIVSDTGSLTERKDQSSWPTNTLDDDGNPSLRGPHNIIRTCCEFALEERSQCEVFLGSPAEIVATLRVRMKPEDESKLYFIDQLSELPVVERCYAAIDATELQQTAQSLGLEISERTAHRILSAQIRPLRSVAARMLHKGSSANKSNSSVDLLRDRRGLKLSDDDTDEFSRMMERDFSFIANRYYLSLAQEPRIRVSHDKIVVTFDIDKHD